MNNILGYIVFTDLKGFSKMNEPDTFFEYTIRPLAKTLRPHKYKSLVWNTWGDALVAVFSKAIDAVEFMIDYRDYFRKNKLLNLQPRISAHRGEMALYNDPLINNMDNVLGEAVNIAARIEPITFPGEIYVSKDFHEGFKKEMEKVKDLQTENERYSQIRFSDLKEWTLPKDAGTLHLYRLFHESEEAWNINSLFVKDKDENINRFFEVLNINNKIKEARKNPIINELKQLQSKEEVEDYLKEEDNINKIKNEKNGPFWIALTEFYRDIGDYNNALTYINEALEWDMELYPKNHVAMKNTRWTNSLNEVQLKPFEHHFPTLKLKADILSKQGDSENVKQAKQILINIIQQDPTDIDALTKFAAQLKRQAFNMDIRDEKVRKEMEDLLREALYLYLEAFRKERTYYPAINAAYIESILSSSNGWHLAFYIFNTWSPDTGKDWWLDSTLAETQLLLGEFEFCFERMERAIHKHQPAFFERHATRDQIRKYIEIFAEINETKSLSFEDLNYAVKLSIVLYNPNLLKQMKDNIDNTFNKLKDTEHEEQLKEDARQIIKAENHELENLVKLIFTSEEKSTLSDNKVENNTNEDSNN